MKTICAWCKGVVEDGPEEERDQVSHGMCRPCFKIEMKKLDEMEAAGTFNKKNNWSGKS
jgi:hypothetical protein